MSDIIRLLPDSVANQIAAGEVIQRPASVIKELVENAVDAGATEINITVLDAGKTMLQVIDNGSGMSDTDARMAFERHATSKIRKASDLSSLRTMGFRGEALPSICAISEVEVRTRTIENQLGTRLVITGSKVESQEPIACDKGTVITVKKLFFNIPARRKFLKSESVELAAIMREFERLALVNNNLKMSINTGTREIRLNSGSFRQRISELWRSNLNENLIPVNVDTSVVKIEGFVSPPQYARRRNQLQFLIVNGRNMRHPFFHKSIISCFEHLIANDTQPNYFIKLTVDPDCIDVNISPTKNEIKFENEQIIRPILVSAVKSSLGKYGAVPSIDFSVEAIDFKPMVGGDLPKNPEIEIDPEYNPFRINTQDSGRSDSRGIFTRRNFGTDWEKLYEGFNSVDSPQSDVEVPEGSQGKTSADFDIQNSLDYLDGIADNNRRSGEHNSLIKEEVEIAPVCLQVELKYIVTTSQRGLIIIDQYRAHEKILYERFLKQIEGSGIVSQSIMFPETIDFDEHQQVLLARAEKQLSHLGFTLEYEEGDKWRITSAPSLVKPSDHKEIVYRILELTSEEGHTYGMEETDENTLYRTMANAMARSAAITGGKKLTTSEMEHLVAELFSLKSPSYTPEGKPVFSILDEARLQALFK